MAGHSTASLGARHAIHNWEYADAAARIAATGFVSADVSKIALQEDDNSLWILTATTPTWVAVSGTGMINPMTTAGDLIYGGASGTATRLAIGTALQVLATNAGATAPEWVSVTGTGNVVRATSPTLVTPILDTPTSGTLTNCTGLPIASGVSGLGTGVATFLETPSSANLLAAVTDETGTGALVFGTSPTITTPTISGAIVFPDGVRQTFNPDGTNAGLNVGSHAGDPSAPSNGDLWYDSTANELTARINGANVALGAGGGGTPGGSNTQLQYNNSSSFGGISGATSDGTNVTFGSGNLRATSPRITTALCDSNGVAVINFTATASATNSVTFANAATGNMPTISTVGGDTNVSLKLDMKGTGALYVNGTNPGVVLSRSGTAKNFFGTATGTDSIITGSVADDFCLRNEASTSFLFSTNAGSNLHFKIAHVASAVNGVQITPSATGAATSVQAIGSDTNIVLKLVPKGNSSVWTDGTNPGFVLATSGTAKNYFINAIATNSGITGSVTDDFCLVNLASKALLFSTDAGSTISFQVMANNGGVRTSAPSGGTAASWKFGTVATVSPTSPNRTIELDVAGTRYFLHAKTTND